jgi:hypothetical protein
MKIDAEVLAISAIALVPSENDDPAALITSCARVTAAAISTSTAARGLSATTPEVIREYALRTSGTPAVADALALLTAACDADFTLLDALASDFGVLDEGVLETMAAILAASLESISRSSGTSPELAFREVLEGLGS